MDAKYIIVGGGIGGLCTAIGLQRQGLDVKIYERAPKLKGLGAGLMLAPNAMKAIKSIGITPEIIVHAQQIKHIGIRSHQGRWLSRNNMETYANNDGLGNFTIHRGELHTALLALLQPDTLIEGKACIGLRQTPEQIAVQFADGSEAIGEYVIGADGIHSAVRQAIAPQSKARYAGYTCWRGVVENISVADFSETWGPKGRFGIVPIKGNRVYFFATKNARENDPEMEAWTAKDLKENFANYHDPISEILDAAEGFPLLWNDIIDLSPIDTYAYGRVLLTGDAAHATTPNMGQGACMAIVDAATLANCIMKNADSQIAFQRFDALRLARTQMIVNNSWNMGRVAQLENPILAGLRNLVMSATPASLAERRLETMYEVDLG